MMGINYSTKDIYSFDNMLKLENSLSENYRILRSGILPKSYIKFPLFTAPMLYVQNGIKRSYTDWRNEYIKEFGFPLFAEDWVKPLANWIGNRHCLEVMAGSGYFSYILKKYGVNSIATDDYSWGNKFTNIKDVEKLDCIEAIRKYGKQVQFIIISWPYMDDNATKCLKCMRKINPKCRMIYIGESSGGCCANDEFFSIVKECDLVTFNKAVKNYRSWYGIHDRILLFK